MHKSEIAAFEAEARTFLAERLAAMGPDEGGLANFYLRKLETGRIFSRYDRELIALLEGEARVVHAGIGIGQLSAALALQGSEVLGFEGDLRRHAAAEALRLRLAPDARYSIAFARFPDGLDPAYDPSGATLLFTNVAATWPDETYEAMFAMMHRFRRTILDLARFGDARQEPAEQAELAERIAAKGLALTPLNFVAEKTAFMEIRRAA
ncbi:hypothetical protein AQZ52_02910 [Novosphingobium fuchskuhlense]|uniref:Methyltransferase domain-containing protein n=1 Tax=Novosphingobium fuchskuhlense TaxID=1117702 RepID=A0A124JVG1_9SPHN|nr:hypothetical protein [Novosphingobium fuchskuhlense]KUR72247.1 hypothetical protein AQZ52_02910 [Novosphingobium fuchskuhlense]